MSSKTARPWPAWFCAVMVLAVAPLFVAALAQAHRGWRPVSDDAAIATLAHDVLSTRTPLVGMPSTIGQDAGAPGAGNEHAHHPGPMMFWALAVPERLADSSPIGLLLGVALVNAAALAAVGFVGLRLLGPRAAVGILAVAGILQWALGRQWIVDPWNPYFGLLPLLALCALTWSAVAGRTRSLIGVAIAGSFVSQTHLIYAPLAAAMLAVSAASVVTTLWSRARRNEAWQREAVISVGGAVSALAVAWALPLYDQFAHSPGNLSAVARSFGAQHGTLVGLDWTLRLDVEAIGLPPLFARQGAGISLIAGSWSSLGPLRVFSAALVVVALAVALVFAVRRHDRIAASAAAIALLALASATIVVSRIPVFFAGAPLYRILQLWPIGCFVWIALAVNGVRALGPHIARRLAPARTAAFAMALGLLAVAPVAIAFADSAVRDDTRSEDAVGRLAAQVAPRLDRGEQYVVELRTEHLFIGGAVQYGLLRELARRGFNTYVDSSDDYLGRSHTAPADAKHLIVIAGRRVIDPAGRGIKQVGAVKLASEADVAHMQRLDAQIRDFLTAPANLTRRGRAVLETATPAADASALNRLRDAGNDGDIGTDTLIVIGDKLVRSDDHTLARLGAADAGAHQLVDDYDFKVYVAQ